MAQSAHNRYALGVDIGGSHVCSAVVDLATGQLCGEPHTDKVDAAAGARTIAGAWAANIRRTAAASGIGCIRCAGFAFPGPFDYERGISLIRGVRKFERIYGLDVAATLYPLLRECGTEEFRYVNDAAAFALGECLGGVADDAERVVALTLGTGVGSGFVAGRRLVTSGDEVPANGWVYCLPFEGGIVDEAFSTRWVCGRYRELTGQEISGAREAAERHAEDPAARRLFDEYGERSHQYQNCDALKPLLVYSLLLTAWAVGLHWRLALSLNIASFAPSVTPFSAPRPTSAMDSRKTLSWTVSDPPPSTLGFATVRVVVSRAASISAPKPVRKPDCASYSL